MKAYCTPVTEVLVSDVSSNSAAASPPPVAEAVPRCPPVASRSGRAGSSPSVSEGGDVFPLVAQADGRGPMSNVSVAPLAICEWLSHVLSCRCPLTVRPCT